MYELMAHPVLTILFDLFIIGSALSVTAAMVGEYLSSREPSVGSARKYQPKYPVTPTQSRRRGTVTPLRPERRRAA
ncbi:MAG TPA: hypothetical protein PKK39_10700 [Tepidiformaceae bacterium]|nr:hypothetical protein [Tepidiformaceae bacterium]